MSTLPAWSADLVPEPAYRWGHQLAEDPRLFELPRVIVPLLAWQGRVTMLAAPEKSGKSTLVGGGVAALTTGKDFLGQATAGPATVAWLALDEPLADCLERLHRYGADLSKVAFFDRLPGEVGWAEAMDAIQPQLLVVDTLTEFAGSRVENFYNAKDWQPVLAQLRREMQAREAACILLHHSTRDGTRYADSRQIGAGVDVILEMAPVPDEPSLRKLQVRGRRIGHSLHRLRFGHDRYYLDAPERSVLERTLLMIEGEPGISKRALRDRIGGRKDAVDDALTQLLRDTLISATSKGFFSVESATTPNSLRANAGHGRATAKSASDEVTTIPDDAGHAENDAGHGRATGGSETRKSLGAMTGHTLATPSGHANRGRPLHGERATVVGASQKTAMISSGPGLEVDIPLPEEFR